MGCAGRICRLPSASLTALPSSSTLAYVISPSRSILQTDRMPAVKHTVSGKCLTHLGARCPARSKVLLHRMTSAAPTQPAAHTPEVERAYLCSKPRNAPQCTQAPLHTQQVMWRYNSPYRGVMGAIRLTWPAGTSATPPPSPTASPASPASCGRAAACCGPCTASAPAASASMGRRSVGQLADYLCKTFFLCRPTLLSKLLDSGAVRPVSICSSMQLQLRADRVRPAIRTRTAVISAAGESSA